MPDYSDLINLVRGPLPEKPLPCIWDFFPCHAGAIGDVPNFLEYYFDVDEKLRLQQKLQKLLPQALILPGIFPDLGVIVEVSAFGGQIIWFEQGAPFIGEAIKDFKEIDSLKLPKAGLSGLMPLALTQREIMRRKLKSQGVEMEHWGMSMGPAEVAGLLLGYENFYLGLYDHPGRIKNLMEMVTELIIEWLHIQDDAFGGMELMCIADHVCNQVTPEQLAEFIVPYERAIFAEFPKAVKIYHNEGLHVDEQIPMVLDFGADIWHFGSDQHDISDLYTKVGDKIVLFGGLDPHGVMRFGKPDEVCDETRKVLQASQNRRLLLSTGTGTTPETTLENQKAMIETVANA
ncbi:MAG: uroporphyrinogen decarboxylase family protein [Desulfobacterales bacterium]|jgi:uroporphyrinogen decarboxylase